MEHIQIAINQVLERCSMKNFLVDVVIWEWRFDTASGKPHDQINKRPTHHSLDAKNREPPGFVQKWDTPKNIKQIHVYHVLSSLSHGLPWTSHFGVISHPVNPHGQAR